MSPPEKEMSPDMPTLCDINALTKETSSSGKLAQHLPSLRAGAVPIKLLQSLELIILARVTNDIRAFY